MFSATQLTRIGITTDHPIYHNPTFDQLYRAELDPDLKGFEKGILTSSGAVTVDTGKFTGRSPQDKYVVKEDSSERHLWWASPDGNGSDNQPLSQRSWNHLKDISTKQLSGKKLYVMDGFCGANPATRLSVRLVTEIAWIAHFFKNMFIRPSEAEIREFKPDWTILHACKASCSDFAKWGLRSEVFVAFHMKERMTVIGGTWYGGEVKKGIFSIMNYFLPLKGIGAFHCSANMGEKGDTALFFGLSGTGKTSLSTDPKRKLIGDDEHGWDNDGVFNFEGGCYAKCINLSMEREPEIFKAVRRDALLENVDLDDKKNVIFTSSKKTENTRVSYPLDHIENIVKPVSKGGHPSNIIFLACDAYGVLPPVAKLTKEQAMYHFLSGYTAKVAGTELGVKEPKATFSACFGRAFLMVHPTKYAEILAKKMEEHSAHCYLINTGWIGGKYGVGTRIPIKYNRASIDAIFSGELERAPMTTMPVFNLQVPTSITGVEQRIVNPRDAWENKSDYDQTLLHLAQMFVENFKKFTDTPIGKSISSAGPQVDKNFSSIHA